MSTFDPIAQGFVRLTDFTVAPGVETFEYHDHPAVDGRVDVLRINIYMTRDGSFTTIWTGLVEPMFAEAKFDDPINVKVHFHEVYYTPLFRGYIESIDEGATILHALRVADEAQNLPQVLRGAPNDIRCEDL